MKTAFAFAIFVTGRSIYGYYDLNLIMLPDFLLYTQGGLGLFPSPIGRLLGAAGPDVFAIISIAASGLCVLGVALVARRCNFAPGLAAGIFALSPASLYLAYAGIDSIALAMLLLALAGTAAGWLLPIAAVTHLSLVPFLLLKLPRTLAAQSALAFVVVVATLSLLMTPYSGVIFGIFHPDALEAMGLGLIVGVGLSMPALLFIRTVPLTYVAALSIGVIECGMQHHLQARYLLPAAALAAAHVVQPSWMRLPKGGFTNSRLSPAIWMVKDER